MLEPIGICRAQGKFLVRMSSDTDTIDIRKTGKKICASLNGRTLIGSKSEKDLVDRGLPVVFLLATVLCKKNGANLKCASAKGSQLSDVLEDVKEHIKPYSVAIFELGKQDEMEDNTPSETSSSNVLGNIGEYQEHFAEMHRNMEELKSLSEILLRTDIKKSMWGSKEVTSVLNRVRNSMERLASEAEHVDQSVERPQYASKHLAGFMTNEKYYPQAKEAASRIIDGFSTMKTYASEMAQNLYGLRDIDRVFKAHTGYPATFLMPSMIMDFQYEYDNLINSMVRTASVEASMIEPLLVWKIRTTGVFNYFKECAK